MNKSISIERESEGRWLVRYRDERAGVILGGHQAYSAQTPRGDLLGNAKTRQEAIAIVVASKLFYGLTGLRREKTIQDVEEIKREFPDVSLPPSAKDMTVNEVALLIAKALCKQTSRPTLDASFNR